MNYSAGTVMARQSKPSPSSSEGDGSTRQVRVFRDMADMIGAIVEVEGGSSAQLLDPLIRADIEARFEAVKPAYEAIRRLKAKHRKASPGEAPEA